MTNTPIRHAMEAATHSAPYAWYADLRRTAPLYFDPMLKLWVASSAGAVAAVFNHPDCRVRPAHEPVPPGIAATPAGEVFVQLVRMNDGARHDMPRLVLQRALGDVDLQQLGQRTAELAAAHHPTDVNALNHALFQLPVQAVADLLGFPSSELPQVALWMRDFVACLSPLSNPAQLEAASPAATALLQRFDALLATPARTTSTLIGKVQAHAAQQGWADRRAVLCNLVGLLSQTYEATAGLIGNSLVALATQADLQAQLQADPHRLAAQASLLVEEVCRFDAPIQNTRRFMARDTSILGHPLRAGDAVLLLLASANRDAALNPDANEFRLHRPQREYFSFGRGTHACPGRQIALTLAASVLTTWLRQARWPELLQHMAWTYHPSVNARIPRFDSTL